MSLGILSSQFTWKLSSKLDKTIVRDPSFPVSRSLLLFWDKTARVAEAAEMNAMAECVCGISRAASEQGFAYTLAWNDGETVLQTPVDSEDALLQTMPRLLKSGCRDAASSALSYLDDMAQPYSKVLYFTAACPSEAETYLLCRQRAHGAVLRRSGPGGRLPRDRLYAGKLPAAIAGFGA